MVLRARVPQPSRGGGVHRPRPIASVRVFGPTTSWLVDGCFDTGCDDTVFPQWVAPLIDLDLAPVAQHPIHLAGRAQPVSCRFLPVKLRITDGFQETYEWTPVVGFAPVPLRYALFGYAGFLEFFNADFHGADQEVFLTPNASFPGRRI